MSKLIFDIGCNLGEFFEACVRKFGRDNRFVVVDANKQILDYWSAPGIDVVKVNAVVANESERSVPFFISMEDGISTASEDFMRNSRFAKGSKNLPFVSRWRDPVYMPTITIDKLIELHGTPDIIKLDIEGYELQALLGLTKKVNMICFEWSEEFLPDLKKCIKHLSSLGYEKFGTIGYFDELPNDLPLTHHDAGDPYLVEPDNYVSAATLVESLESVCNIDRRVNYGMCFCK